MNLIPWRNKQHDGDEPVPLTAFRNEMDRLFDTFLREPFGNVDWPWRGEQGWMPAIDVAENDQEVTVRAELPGIDPKDLDVTITGQQLVISGQKQESSERKDRDCSQSEIRFGSFRRAVALPENIDPDKVDAQFANGLLTLSIKKTVATPPKKIAITKSSG